MIDYTYFQKRLLAIPNLQEGVLEQLNDYIDLYEKRFLELFLGVQLRNDFMAGLEQPVIAPNWLALRDGVEYVKSDITYRWDGLTNSDKVSPIANYVFCNLTANNQFINTGIGEVRALAENSIIITPQYRISQVWNEMVEMNKSLLHYLDHSYHTDYENWNRNTCNILLKYDGNIGL
jgi:hypothetical protein